MKECVAEGLCVEWDTSELVADRVVRESGVGGREVLTKVVN